MKIDSQLKIDVWAVVNVANGEVMKLYLAKYEAEAFATASQGYGANYEVVKLASKPGFTSAGL